MFRCPSGWLCRKQPNKSRRQGNATPDDCPEAGANQLLSEAGLVAGGGSPHQASRQVASRLPQSLEEFV